MNIICGYGTLVMRERIEAAHQQQTARKVVELQKLLYPGRFGDDFLYKKMGDFSNCVIGAYGIFPVSGKGHERNERQLKRIGERAREKANYLANREVLTPQEQYERESLQLLGMSVRVSLFTHNLGRGLIVDLSARLRRLFLVASHTSGTYHTSLDNVIREALSKDVVISSSDIERIAWLTTSPDKKFREEIQEDMRQGMTRLIDLSREKKILFWNRRDEREPTKYSLAQDILISHLEWVEEYPEYTV